MEHGEMRMRQEKHPLQERVDLLQRLEVVMELLRLHGPENTVPSFAPLRCPPRVERFELHLHGAQSGRRLDQCKRFRDDRLIF